MSETLISQMGSADATMPRQRPEIFLFLHRRKACCTVQIAVSRRMRTPERLQLKRLFSTDPFEFESVLHRQFVSLVSTPHAHYYACWITSCI